MEVLRRQPYSVGGAGGTCKEEEQEEEEEEDCKRSKGKVLTDECMYVNNIREVYNIFLP